MEHAELGSRLVPLSFPSVSLPLPFFSLVITPLPGNPSGKLLAFHPYLPDRQYNLEYTPSVGAPSQPPLDGFELGLGQTRVVVGHHASAAARFYRVRISGP